MAAKWIALKGSLPPTACPVLPPALPNYLALRRRQVRAHGRDWRALCHHHRLPDAGGQHRHAARARLHRAGAGGGPGVWRNVRQPLKVGRRQAGCAHATPYLPRSSWTIHTINTACLLPPPLPFTGARAAGGPAGPGAAADRHGAQLGGRGGAVPRAGARQRGLSAWLIAVQPGCGMQRSSGRWEAAGTELAAHWQPT